MSSTSSRIHEYLRLLDPEAEFTSEMLASELGVTEGAVTGFISKLKSAGGVRIVSAKRPYTYVVGDLSAVNVRSSGRGGGQAGRKTPGTTLEDRLAGVLRDVADQLLAPRPAPSLSVYSTADLIRELARRERKREGSSE